MQKIRVCHVVTTLGVGGMENGIVNLANNHDRAKFAISICCLNKAGAFSKRLREDVGLYVLDEVDGFSLARIFRVAAFFRKIQPDIVHTHSWGGGSLYGILGARLAGVPIVVNGEHGSFFTRKYQLILQRILFMLCHANLSVSGALKDRISSTLGVPAKKIKVIRNGVDIEKFCGCYPVKDVLRKLQNEGYTLEKDAFRISIIGSLKPEKSQKTLLQAVRKLVMVENLNALNVLIIGEGPDRSMLEQYVADSLLAAKVFFLGNRDDIAELLSLTDLFVSTSIAQHEGLSNVLLESMASGVPVIATLSVGSQEIVDEKFNGFLIQEGDAEKLAEYIKCLYVDREELAKMAKNAIATVEEQFTIGEMVSGYENLYFQLIKKNLA